MKKIQPTFKLSIKFFNQPTVAEVIKVVLYRLGLQDQDIVEYEHYPYFSFVVYFNRLKTARKFYGLLRKQKLKKVKITLKKFQPQQWLTKGAEQFKSFKLTKRLYVVAEKQQQRFKTKDKIVLTTGLAFGSGLHETTRFMAHLIEDYAKPSDTFLDVGTGTGILILVALKNGVKKIRAIDMTQDCVKVARSNLAMNGFSSIGVRAVDLKKFKPQKPFSFVAANLITEVLIEHRFKLISLVSSGGYLALSGISLENYGFLKNHFKKLPLKCIKVIKGKEWVAILFKRI